MLDFELSQYSAALAVAALLPALFLLARPQETARALRALPRSAWAGRVLSAAALLWAGALVHSEPLEFLLPYRRWILPLMVLAVPLTWLATPELLACRATGALMALLPAPVLMVARTHPSPWRLAMVILMYLMAVGGMWLMMSPYRLRDLILRTLRSEGAARATGGMLLAFAIFLGLLAWHY